jgi:NTP pyrophosphatase (non-canonical NTP hydrolase)
MRNYKLTFKKLKSANRRRNREAFDGGGWTASDWGNALAGEVGEACNFIKKMRRGDQIAMKDIGKELADVVTYADLLAQHLGLDLEECVRQKFNEVSARHGSEIRL